MEDLDDLLAGDAKGGAVKAKPPAPTPIVAPTPPKRSPASTPITITCMVSHGGRLFAALADGRLLVSDMRRPTDRWEEVRFDG